MAAKGSTSCGSHAPLWTCTESTFQVTSRNKGFVDSACLERIAKWLTPTVLVGLRSLLRPSSAKIVNLCDTRSRAKSEGSTLRNGSRPAPFRCLLRQKHNVRRIDAEVHNLAHREPAAGARDDPRSVAHIDIVHPRTPSI